jgi:hypothetical protein
MDLQQSCIPNSTFPMKIQQDRSARQPSELVKQNPPNHSLRSVAVSRRRSPPSCPNEPAHPSPPAPHLPKKRHGTSPNPRPRRLTCPSDRPQTCPFCHGALCVNSRRVCVYMWLFWLSASSPTQLTIFIQDPCMRVCLHVGYALICGSACASRSTAAGKAPRHSHSRDKQMVSSAIQAPPARLCLLHDTRRIRRVSQGWCCFCTPTRVRDGR